MPLNKTHKKLTIFSVILLGVFSLIFTQRFSLYIDVSPSKNLRPPPFLKTQLSNIDAPFKFTFFTSNHLANELNIPILMRWLSAISPAIQIKQFDPVKFPAKADHYDITTDGVIVIEYKNQRQDIDLIEQIIVNETYGLENSQNAISRAIIQLSQLSPPNLLLIHANSAPLLTNSNPMGLSTLAMIAESNFIKLSECRVNELSTLTQQYDLIIFYKLTESARSQLPVLQRLYEQSESSIIFNHPKFSDISNQLMPDQMVHFNRGIIEDTTNHLMNATNQLIIEYQSPYQKTLIGAFPFSSNIDPTDGLTALASTGESAFLLLNDDVIPGPLSIIFQTPSKTRTFINNYLIATNAWIHQGENHLIIEDILNTHLTPFPIISSRDTRDDAILMTKQNLLKLAIMLIALPFILILLLHFFYQLWFTTASHPPSSQR